LDSGLPQSTLVTSGRSGVPPVFRQSPTARSAADEDEQPAKPPIAMIDPATTAGRFCT